MPAIRSDERTHEIVREIASEDHMSMPEVLARAVEEYRRRRFLKAANQAFAALRSRPQVWAEELEERAIWDETVSDGLEEDE